MTDAITPAGLDSLVLSADVGLASWVELERLLEGDEGIALERASDAQRALGELLEEMGADVHWY